jgi:hypothetical protein
MTQTPSPFHFLQVGFACLSALSALRALSRGRVRILLPFFCVQASRFALNHALRALRALSRGRVRMTSQLFENKFSTFASHAHFACTQKGPAQIRRAYNLTYLSK